MVGNASFFDLANSEYLSHADSTNVSVADQSFSITGWAKATTLVGGMVIASHGRQAVNQRSWKLWWDSSVGKFEFSVSNDGVTSDDVDAIIFGAVSTNVWNFVVGVCDHNNIIKISVNAGLQNTAAHLSGVHDSTALFIIGARDLADYWDGAIQTLRYGRKHNNEQKSQLCAGGTAPPACCPF